MLTFQQIILNLQNYWSNNGCLLLQPYDIEVGAGTSHTATFLNAIGPEPWSSAYVQACRRPKDGRYGKNPNRLQHYYQYQVILKPAPENILELYINSLRELNIDILKNDIRFVEDNWENPTLGAWGLGWEVWLNGMEISQFTYFQQVASIDCNPIMGEITYGLERLAMHLQSLENVYEIIWARTPFRNIYYHDIFHQHEVEKSIYNFDFSSVEMLFRHFDDFESEAYRLIEASLALPAYEFVLKASHIFNLLEARCVISITERVNYINKIRKISRLVGKAYYLSRKKLNFPMLNDNGLSK